MIERENVKSIYASAIQVRACYTFYIPIVGRLVYSSSYSCLATPRPFFSSFPYTVYIQRIYDLGSCCVGNQ